MDAGGDVPGAFGGRAHAETQEDQRQRQSGRTRWARRALIFRRGRLFIFLLLSLLLVFGDPRRQGSWYSSSQCSLAIE